MTMLVFLESHGGELQKGSPATALGTFLGYTGFTVP